MKIRNWINKSIVVIVLTLMQFIFVPVSAVHAATSPTLGNAASFAVLAGTAISNVPTSVITGDVGLSPAAGSNITGLTNAEVSGTIFAPDVSGPAGPSGNNPGLLTNAKNDLITAYDGLSAAPNVACTVDYGAGDTDLASLTLTPGIYCSGTFSLSGVLTLDDTAAADGVWIFRSAATVTTSAGSSVVFLNDLASSCNVWWKVASSATLGTTTAFVGNILALTSITMNTGATLEGRALARNGAVTLQSNTISQTCSTLQNRVTYYPLTSGGTTSSYCPPTSYVAPIIIDSKRVDADSVFLSWGPYSGTDTFIVEYGTENGKWLYNTRVTGFSTTLNSLPTNTPIWARVVATDYCSEGEYGLSKIIGGPGLPNTGFKPKTNTMLLVVSTSLLITVSVYLLKRSRI